jgi:uncharacterized protein
MIYFDSTYVAKFYLNEPGHELVQACAISAGDVATCEWAFAEVTAVFHRKLREGFLTPAEAAIFFAEFDRDVQHGLWKLLPLNSELLEQVAGAFRTLPASVFLRSADALHLICARENGFAEIHTNDRHLLASAPYLGLKGVDVISSAL